MNKTIYVLLTTVILVMVVFLFTNNISQNQTNETEIMDGQSQNTVLEAEEIVMAGNMSSDLIKNIDKVITSLETVKEITEQNLDKVKKLQQAGKKLDEKWDVIEKQVEDKYPNDYANIEQSLYPLVYEIKKNDPNLKVIKRLNNATIEKVSDFKKKVAASAS